MCLGGAVIMILEMCDFCKQLNSDLYITMDGNLICSDCMKKLNYRKCDDTYCSKCDKDSNLIPVYHLASNGTIVVQYFCSSCFKGYLHYNFELCSGCQKVWNMNALTIAFDRDEKKKHVLCPECVEKYRSTHTNSLYGPYVENGCMDELYGCDYNPLPVSSDDIDNINGKVLRFGIEIELDGGGYSPFNTNRLLEVLGTDFGRCMSDSSLDNGIEFSTYPITITQLKNNGYWDRIKEFFSLAKDLGYGTPRTCGLHVHYSRDYLNGEDRKMEKWLTSFCYNYRKELIAISGRDKENDYAKFPEDDIPDEHCRYRAVNIISSKPTIEIRFWGGTMGSVIILNRIEFGILLFRYAKKINYDLKVLERFSFQDICAQMGMFENTQLALGTYLRFMLERAGLWDSKKAEKVVKKNKFNLQRWLNALVR